MSYLNLKGFDSVFDHSLINEIQDNLVEFLDWTLLEKNNYFNVTLNEMSTDGTEDLSKLRISSSEHYASGQAWEGFRKNWIWQSGIYVSGVPEPLVGDNNSKPGISGVYVNSVFYPSDTEGDYQHSVDYFNGRVIFDNPIPVDSDVQAEYSYKYINILYANNLPWLREIQYRTLEPNSFFSNQSRGDFTLPAEARIQLPAIAVEVVPKRTLSGYQLGGGQYIYTDVIFHCLAEDAYTRNQLLDIISLQNEKRIYMFDSNMIADSGAFPLDYNGFPVSGALRYPDLLYSYSGTDRQLRLNNMNVQNMDVINGNFYGGIVRATTEFIKTNI